MCYLFTASSVDLCFDLPDPIEEGGGGGSQYKDGFLW